MSVRTVVVGYGRAGRSFHCYLIGLTPGLELHGVVSSSAEKRERIVEDHKCRAYAAVDETLGDVDVDLIVLATPNSTHAELAILAMELKKGFNFTATGIDTLSLTALRMIR